MKKIRVLLLLDEAWNDKLYPNNNMTNWFDGFEGIELATIYCSPEMPDNQCCTRYYQITDHMMLDSLLKGKKAGQVLSLTEKTDNTGNSVELDKGVLRRLKSIRTETMRLGRDILWLAGKYDEQSLKSFILDFHPDIIFSARRGSVKLCRLERIVKQLANVPLVAFTGDNEREEGVISISPAAWIRKAMVRKALDKTIPMYSLYYTGAREQAEAYCQQYGVPTSLIFKCGVPDADRIHTVVHTPIRMVYAGKLYCGRWKTLAAIAKALADINHGSVKMVLDIYTRDQVTTKQQKVLHDGTNTFLRGAVSPNELPDIYKAADIALHVESFDRHNRAITKHSYSTKVVDCLACGCAVMAVGWEKHSACIELKYNDSAIVITSLSEIPNDLLEISKNPKVILEYANKAGIELRENHSKVKVQNQLYHDFLKIIGAHRHDC